MGSDAVKMKREAWLEGELARLGDAGLRRQLRTWTSVGPHLAAEDGRPLLNLASNDYLALARHPDVIAAARRALYDYGAGATASRMVTGTLPCHTILEERLASHRGYPAALLFSSGYAANLGVLTSLARRGDHVFADRLIHASLIDAARLCGAGLHRFRHNDATHLAELLAQAPARGRRIVAVESVFSMDGDLAPLDDLAAVADRYDALLVVDEAHAEGVFGPGGRGRVAEAGLQDKVNLCVATLSKALGSAGGFVACSEPMRTHLLHRARSFIYSTATPPAAMGAALGALNVLARDPGRGAEVLARAYLFRQRLAAAGLETLRSQSQIVPVLLGDAERTMAVAARLEEGGILAAAIRPPSVPPGTARLRFSITYGHAPEELERAADCIVAAVQAEGAA